MTRTTARPSAAWSGIAVAACLVVLGGCGVLAGLHDLPLPADAGSEAPEAGAPSGDAPAPTGDVEGEDGDGGACTCVTVPTGWQGPLALYSGSSALPAPGCTGTYGAASFQGSADPTLPAASCTACSCGAQVGAQCGAQLSYYTNACGSTSTGCGSEDYALNAGQCQGLGTGNGGCAGRDVQSFQAAGVESQAGTCPPSAAIPNGSSPSWGTTAVACAPASAASCASGQVCAPAPDAPFGNLCIEAAGAQACPSGTPFATPHAYYTSFEDTRACSACACSAPPPPTCSASGTVTFWTAFTCTGTPTGSVVINDANASGCEALPSMSYYSTYAPTMFTVGACPPSGGTPSGSVAPAPSSLVTFCCTQ